ncbi:MAG: rhomboid family intramembrane serine protease [Planctomycetota bacterium]|nr:rhomboid family intramembrane serine protease [Planctomycetota bacterium]
MSTVGGGLLAAAPLTALVLALNVILYLVCAARSHDAVAISRDVLWSMGGSMPEGLWEGEWLRLIAPSFLHGNLFHILINSISLYYLGPAAEVFFGSPNYGTLYIVSGVAGFCFSQIFGGRLSIGASCSLFGILGAMLVVRILACPVVKHAWRNADVRRYFAVLVFYLAIGVLGLLGPVDNWGHLGGLVMGVLAGGLFEIWRRRGRMSYMPVAGAVAVVVLIVCAARWPVYNPYYHLHLSVLAQQDKRPEDAARQLQEAREWSRVWGKQGTMDRLIVAYNEHAWTLHEAREHGYAELARAVSPPRRE